MRISMHLSGLMLVTSLLLPALSQAEALQSSVFATVNGETLSQDMFQFLLGARDSENSPMGEHPDMTPQQKRASVAQDLVLTEVLAQEALRKKIDARADNRIELELARKTLLAQLMVQEIMAGLSVSDEAVRQAYDAEPATTLYRFNLWMAKTEKEAQKLLTELKNVHSGDEGQKRAQLDQAYPKIETPWLDQSELDPEVVARLTEVEAGDFLEQAVFQDDIWKVVQVIERDIFEKPSFEEAKEVIRAELIQAEVDLAIQRLSQQSKIQVNDALL